MNTLSLQSLAAIGHLEQPTLLTLGNTLVEEAVRLTGSAIGYFAVLNEADDELIMISWSQSAMAACSMSDKPIIYPLEATGLWGDCIRERQPVITNDYEACERVTKKGYPDGHVNVVRHMNVPIWESGQIIGILGVGNRDTDYSEEDAQLLQEFANAGASHVRVAKSR
jgi:GAF domain-containing protein